MSKYTTEVRFICETKSGLNESVGLSNVDEVIDKSWGKIFTTNVTFFDETYRSVLCKKILKHFYLREIGAETFGVWCLWLNTRLEEIMPYYNQLYETALIKFNPLHDVDVTRTHTRDENKKENTDVNNTGDNTLIKTGGNTLEENNNKKDLYSDTPQGALTGVETETYLTNARKINENNTVNTKLNENNKTVFNTTTNTNGNINTTEDYVESVTGKQSAKTYGQMLMEFRESLINIDLMVIEEFNDLFLNLW